MFFRISFNIHFEETVKFLVSRKGNFLELKLDMYKLMDNNIDI